MKIVQVGVGGMGGVHFNIYKNLEGIEYAAVCDIRTDMLKQVRTGPSVQALPLHAEHAGR